MTVMYEKGTIVRQGVNNCKDAIASFLTQAQCNGKSAAVLEAKPYLARNRLTP